MQAIIYTSNTGNTQKYAEMLSEKTGLPAYSAGKAPQIDGEIIYMGWVMAGSISGLSEARGKYKIGAVCAVGMFPESNEKMLSEIREKNHVEAPLYYLPGGFSLKKLSGMYRMMMGMMVRKIKSEFEKKETVTEADKKSLELFTEGCDFVSEELLEPVMQDLFEAQ